MTFNQARISVKMLGILLAVLAITAGSAVHASESLDLAQYRGKVVMLDFWASWCVPCRRSFPWMNEMQQKYGEDGLVIIAVNLDSEIEEAQAFLDEYPADFTTASDPDRSLARDFGVVAMPSTYIINRDGDVVTRHLGFKVGKQDEYEAALVETLAAATE